MVFDAHIDRIIKTEYPLTNQRLLSKKKVKEVFHIMKNHEKDTRLTELVLRHVRYIVRGRNADGTVTVKGQDCVAGRRCSEGVYLILHSGAILSFTVVQSRPLLCMTIPVCT